MAARSRPSPHRNDNQPGGARRPAGWPLRRNLAIAIAALLVLGAAGYVTYAVVRIADAAPLTSSPNPADRILTYNGAAVPFRALNLYLVRDRSTVLSEYQNRGVDIQDPSFWQTPVAGKTPAQQLVDSARTDVVQLQAQLDVIREAGIAGPTSYDEIVRAWQVENHRRAAAVLQGTPIYGPKQYSEPDYLDYLLGNLGQEAQRALTTAGKIDESDAGAMRYFNAHRADFSGDFTSVRDQAVRRYAEYQYQGLIDAVAQHAVVKESAAYRDLYRTQCVAQGSC